MCPVRIFGLFLISSVAVLFATGDTTTIEYQHQTTYSISVASTTEVPSTETQSPNEGYSPFQVSLHYTYNDEFICGGSIISPTVVLTAAHCMYYRWGGLMPPIIVTVSAGRRKLNEPAWRTFNVANITLHPSFNENTLKNDLALIEIEGKFEADNRVGQIDVAKYLPQMEYNSCIVTGWNQNTNEFQVMEVVLGDCGDFSSHICTNKKYGNDGVCINNAGNPLVCDEKLIGVLSVEPNCEDAAQLAIFENIRHSMSWLTENAKASSGTIKVHYKYMYSLFLYLLLKPILYIPQ